MKNILQNLEASNFIGNVHKTTLWADCLQFAKLIRDNPKSLHIIKTYVGSDSHIRDLRTKFNLMTSGFYDFLKTYLTTSDADIMLSCNIDDELLLVAFKDIQDEEKIVSYNFSTYGMLPIHLSTISLDFSNKIHILLYDRKFNFPGLTLN